MRIFSGIQPSGAVHLGNYLGAIKQWVHMQRSASADTRLVFSIVDLHALSTLPSVRQARQGVMLPNLRRQTQSMAATLLACGLDTKRSVLYHQSALPEHSQLLWLLSCIAPLGRLQRMTQFKVHGDVVVSPPHFFLFFFFPTFHLFAGEECK